MAQSNANSVTDNIDQAVECTICQEHFDDPRALPCLHTFCLKCLKDLCKGTAPGTSVPCPLCRKEFQAPSGGLTGLPKNFHIETLVSLQSQLLRSSDLAVKDEDEAPKCQVCHKSRQTSQNTVATHCCWQCDQLMCAGCARTHASRKKHQGVVELQVRNCERHANQFLETYCDDCKAVCCSTCFAASHTNHSATDVRLAAHNMCENIEGYASNVSHRLSDVSQTLNALKTAGQNFVKHCKQTETKIEEAVRTAKCLIDTDGGFLLSRVSTRKKKTCEQLQRQRTVAELQQQQMTEFVEKCKQVAKSGNPVEIIQEFDGLRTVYQDLLVLTCSAERSVPEFRFVERELRKFIPTPNLVGEITVDGSDSTLASLPSWSELNVCLMTEKELRFDLLRDLVDNQGRLIVKMYTPNADALKQKVYQLKSSFAASEMKVENRDKKIGLLIYFAQVVLVIGLLIAFRCMESLAASYWYDMEEIQTKTARIAASRLDSALLGELGEDNCDISGLATLPGEIYVRHERSNYIQVFDARSLILRRTFLVNGVPVSADLAASLVRQRIYIYQNDDERTTLSTIDKVDVQSTQKSFRWLPKLQNLFRDRFRLTADDTQLLAVEATNRPPRVCTISMTIEANIVVTSREENRIWAMLDNGTCTENVTLPHDVRHPHHAVRRYTGEYIVCHGDQGDPLHRVVIIDSYGRIRSEFGERPGSGVGRLNRPVYIAVGGFVFVADSGNERVVMLSPDLVFVRQVVSGVRANRLAVDVQLGQLYVADSRVVHVKDPGQELWVRGRVKIYRLV